MNWDETYRQPAIGHWRDSSRLNVLIGHTRDGKEIMYWPAYGIVCPDVVTTNGSPWYLLKTRGRPTSLTPPGAAYWIGLFFYAWHQGYL